MTTPNDEQPTEVNRSHNGPITSRRGMILTAVILVGLVIAAVTTFSLLRSNNVGPLKDSGVAACEAIAAQKGITSSQDKKKMTAEEYQTLRKTFSGSRYADIRDPGVRIVNSLYQFQSVPEDQQLGMALALMGSLITDYGQLSGGCAAHGVTLPTLGSIFNSTPSPAASPADQLPTVTPPAGPSPPAGVLERCRKAYEDGDMATYQKLECNRYGN